MAAAEASELVECQELQEQEVRCLFKIECMCVSYIVLSGWAGLRVCACVWVCRVSTGAGCAMRWYVVSESIDHPPPL